MARYSYETLREEYSRLWAGMMVTHVAQANIEARAIIGAKERYLKVEARTGVKWFVVGLLHVREAGLEHGKPRFDRWLHNGDPMKDKQGRPTQTIHEPFHRPPDPKVSWEDGAYDALVVVERLDQIKDWGPERVAYASEKFNGFGYRSPSRNIPSPYLWGGTNIQKRGKFVEDGKYDKTVMDSQIGSMAVLKQLMVLDDDARFEESKPASPEVPVIVPVDAAEPMSPRATDTDDEIKPLAKSKTIWGGIIGAMSGFGGTVAAFFQHLDNPYTLAAFVIIIIGIAVGAVLVIRGRIDVNKIVEHLTDDTTETVQG